MPSGLFSRRSTACCLASPLRKIGVGQIIEEAGLSRATFYFYFSSKFAVLGGMLAAVADELSAAIEAPEGADGDHGRSPTDRLTTRLEAIADVWIAHRTVLRAAAESWHAVPELRAVWLVAAAEFTDALAGEIARDRRERRLAAEPRQLAALVLWTLERNLYVAGLKIDEGLPPERETAGLLGALWGTAIYGRPARAARST